MTNTPKEIKRVSVRSHIKKTKHGAVTVKQHKRLEEVNVDVPEFHEEQIGYETTQRGNKTEATKHKVQDQIDSLLANLANLSDDEQNIGAALAMYNTNFNTAHGERFDDPSDLNLAYLNYSHAMHSYLLTPESEVIRKLKDPEFVKETVTRMDEIEEAFAKHMGVDTERINPFTFRFFDKQAIDSLQMDGNDLFPVDLMVTKATGAHGARDFRKYFASKTNHKSQIVDDVNKNYLTPEEGKSINFKKLSNTILPAKAFRLIADSISDLDTRQKVMGFIEKVPNVASNSIVDVIQRNGGSDGYLSKDTELLRKEVLRELRKSSKEGSNKDIIQRFKNAPTTHIIPMMEFISQSGYDPVGFLSDEKFMTSIKNQANSTTSRQQQTANNPHKGHVYVSNSPMELLAMSPAGNFESCQSICDSNGTQTVNTGNQNILASINVNKTSDFVAMTLNRTKKGDEKTARMSLWYNKNEGRFRNQEYGEVYGNNTDHQDWLRSVYSRIPNDGDFQIDSYLEAKSFINKVAEPAMNALMRSKLPEIEDLQSIEESGMILSKELESKKKGTKEHTEIVTKLKALEKVHDELRLKAKDKQSKVKISDIEDGYERGVQSFMNSGNSALYSSDTNKALLLRQLGVNYISSQSVELFKEFFHKKLTSTGRAALGYGVGSKKEMKPF